MSVTTNLYPDGSLAVCDNGITFPPLSPEAVQAVAAQAAASANAFKTQEMTLVLSKLALLITGAAPLAGNLAYAQVVVVPGSATAVLDATSFAMVQQELPGVSDGSGNWVVGPLTISKQVPPSPPPPPPPPPVVGP